MRKTGGEFLGQGAYACAIYPSIMCIDGKTHNGVSKLFADSMSYEEEVYQARKVAKIDPNGTYY